MKFLLLGLCTVAVIGVASPSLVWAPVATAYTREIVSEVENQVATTTSATPKLTLDCSCVQFVRDRVPSLPRGDADQLKPNSPPVEGGVVILKYPNGIYHVAYSARLQGIGVWIEERIQMGDECIERSYWLDLNDEKIFGFWSPI